MQDILLSTSSTASGSLSGVVSSGGGESVSGRKGDGSVGNFRALFSDALSADTAQADKLADIVSKLETLGLSPSLLSEFGDMLGKHFGGNGVSGLGSLTGTELPPLLASFTESLNALDLQLSQLIEDDLKLNESQFLELMEPVASALMPLQTAFSSKFDMPAGDRLTSFNAASLSGGEASSKVNLSAEDLGNNGARLMVDQRAGVVKAESTLNPLESPMYQEMKVLSGEQGSASLFKDQSLSVDQSDLLTDRVLSQVGDKGSSSSIKASFSDMQAKLDAGPYSTTVMTGLDDVEWGDEVSQKIVWLTGKAIQSAEIHLNPADLGPIDVKISVQNDAASITFNAHNSSVRELLESNVVRLREMMEQNGVELQEVNVDARQNEQRFGSSSEEQKEGSGQGAGDDGTDRDSAELLEETVSTASSNLVDFFA